MKSFIEQVLKHNSIFDNRATTDWNYEYLLNIRGCYFKRRHDIQQNNTQHNDTKPNDPQQTDAQNSGNQHYDTQLKPSA